MPVALCAAEMATVEGWKNGGIFSWVSQTLGERFGFAAIFFQWFQITVGFVTMIYFILGALSYVLNFQALNTDPLIKFIGLLIIFWGLTFFSIRWDATDCQISKSRLCSWNSDSIGYLVWIGSGILYRRQPYRNTN